MDRPDTPHPCVQKEHRGKRQNQVGSQEGELGKTGARPGSEKGQTRPSQGSDRHHVKSDKIRRNETMKTSKKLSAGTAQMRE
jgi:hypothetical protein